MIRITITIIIVITIKITLAITSIIKLSRIKSILALVKKYN